MGWFFWCQPCLRCMFLTNNIFSFSPSPSWSAVWADTSSWWAYSPCTPPSRQDMSSRFKVENNSMVLGLNYSLIWSGCLSWIFCILNDILMWIHTTRFRGGYPVFDPDLNLKNSCPNFSFNGSEKSCGSGSTETRNIGLIGGVTVCWTWIRLDLNFLRICSNFKYFRPKYLMIYWDLAVFEIQIWIFESRSKRIRNTCFRSCSVSDLDL